MLAILGYMQSLFLPPPPIGSWDRVGRGSCPKSPPLPNRAPVLGKTLGDVT
jgi:hypothetical protein